ncbi:serine/threonine-protein kinase [Streptomyces sp. NPDC001544]|uniref:serine/threonine-protein kinase n=1 Tax=Streptomyces sp. NPDC001544 TaxID=3364584 RepID=UPI0036ACAA57
MAGRYRLAESIGQGGMGRVWRAADEILDREVAVKEMRIDGLDAEDTRTRRERTLREARATARIDHPNVVRVYDVVDAGERLWIVMELVAGRSLEHIMATEGPLGPREAARIGLGLVAALRQVHAGGVLHRDIKPGNVLVEAAGNRVVLTDFGIAAIQDAKALTVVGMLVGFSDYMAPERISGRRQGPPSDVWSLGATLCAALAGRSPFSRDTTLATLHAVLYEEPELPPGAGPLHDILAALLEKVAVAAVVAVLLTTSADGPGDDAHAGSSPGTSAATSAPTSPSATSLSPTGPAPTVEGTSRPQSLPPGAHREAGGYAWRTPEGWRRDVKTGAEVHYTSPDGRQELVAKSSLARGDLLDTWRASERNARQGRDYAKIRLAETTFQGHPAVVWEYTFTLKDVAWHARLLGFDANGKSYQVNTWYQPEIEDGALSTYDMVKDSFTVL